jgi:hypothetical protein
VCLLLSNIRFTLSIAVLVCLMTSCLTYYRLQPTWNIDVSNTTRGSLNPDLEFEPCVGLRGTITFPASGVSFTSDLISQGGQFREAVKHKSKAGDPVVFEAQCFGSGDVELGYVKVEGKIFSSAPSYILGVYPPLLSGGVCFQVTESRGTKTPCLLVSGL